jgi:penicillin-binding protein 1A
MAARKRATPAAPRAAKAEDRDDVLRAPRRRRAARRRRRKPTGGRLLGFAAEGAFYLFALAIAAAAVLTHFARDLPRTDGIWAASGPRTTFLAADGAPLRVGGESRGAPVRLADLQPHTPAAILAVEDRNFYHHIGVNPLSVARALVVNAAEGEVRQGGSTLTQQLAKNLFLSSERTFKRKMQELMLALWLERRFSKDEILTLYLNRVYFGAGAYGVDAASWRYFSKPATSLTLAESALLAGLLKAPSQLAPDRNPEDAGARARLVVDQMLDAGFITREAASAAYATPIRLAASRMGSAPWFIDYAAREARKLAKGVDADLVVRTTFDARLQEALETGVAAGAALAGLDPSMEVAAVLMEKDGAVRALVGGRDFSSSQFNRAVDARRQPGSAFKPFVFLAAVEAGVSADDLVEDSPIAIGRWAPSNYKDRYLGETSVRTALAHSLNAATIRLQESIGRNAVRRMARRMGVEGDLSDGPALALGVDAVTPLELARAYAPFANGGYRVAAHAVSRIDLADGGALFRNEAGFSEQAASAQSIAALNEMLAEVVRAGTGKSARLTRAEARGKSGTTQESRDAWFAGHAGGLVCVVWIGRDNNQPMGDMTGGAAPAIIWREAMERALMQRAAPIAIIN